MSSLIQTPGILYGGALSVAVISSDRHRSIKATSGLAQCGDVRIREFNDFPATLADVPLLLEHGFDAILIDLDGDTRFSLELVEAICIARSSIVMVFSAQADPDLILRSMRAGAREFFSLPFNHEALNKALQWVAAHRQTTPTAAKADGRLMVFFGAKGGVGVTTLASNFAVALAEESRQSTLLIDLNIHLGDAAMNLGIHADYSIVDALQSATDLGPSLLSRFLVHHSSGLSVLAAPAELSEAKATEVAIGCLLAVARKQFHFVVVDAGKKVDLKQMHLFEESSTAYLVTQVGIPELRNANRLISQFSADRSPKLEIVINRYQPRFLGLTDEQLNKALTRSVQWRVPNDFKAVRQMQSSATPLVHQDTPIAAMIRQMARSACGATASSQRENGRNASGGGLGFLWKGASKRPGPETGRAEAPPAQSKVARSLTEAFSR